MKPGLLAELPPHAIVLRSPALPSTQLWRLVPVSETGLLSMEMAGVLEVGACSAVALTVGGFEEPRLGVDPSL